MSLEGPLVRPSGRGSSRPGDASARPTHWKRAAALRLRFDPSPEMWLAPVIADLELVGLHPSALLLADARERTAHLASLVELTESGLREFYEAISTSEGMRRLTKEFLAQGRRVLRAPLTALRTRPTDPPFLIREAADAVATGCHACRSSLRDSERSFRILSKVTQVLRTPRSSRHHSGPARSSAGCCGTRSCGGDCWRGPDGDGDHRPCRFHTGGRAGGPPPDAGTAGTSGRANAGPRPQARASGPGGGPQYVSSFDQPPSTQA